MNKHHPEDQAVSLTNNRHIGKIMLNAIIQAIKSCGHFILVLLRMPIFISGVIIATVIIIIMVIAISIIFITLLLLAPLWLLIPKKIREDLVNWWKED